jgi:hypothetical protein
MSKAIKTTVLYDPKPKEDLKLPPLVRRPYEQSSGTLLKIPSQSKPELSSALSNIRI